jgi:hypothetical protein
MAGFGAMFQPESFQILYRNVTLTPRFYLVDRHNYVSRTRVWGFPYSVIKILSEIYIISTVHFRHELIVVNFNLPIYQLI